MHEVSIVEGIISHLENHREKDKFKKVSLVEITCGKYNCASEETLQFCYDTAVKGTWLEKAKIVVRRLNEQYKCASCNKDFFLEGAQKTCSCGSSDIFPHINSDLYISKLEVE